MTVSFHKVAKGDTITAAKWNSVVDRLPMEDTGDGAAIGDLNPNRVWCQNNTGADRDMGELVDVKTWDGPDDTNEYDPRESALFIGESPADDTPDRRVGVWLDPVPVDEWGWVAVGGLALAKINFGSDDDGFIALDVGNDPHVAKTAGAGFASILQRVTNDNWAVVRMPVGGGGAKLYRTPTDGIPAGTISQTGSASCDVYRIAPDGSITATGNPETVHNPFTTAIGGDVFITAQNIDGQQTIDAEDCGGPPPPIMEWAGNYVEPALLANAPPVMATPTSGPFTKYNVCEDNGWLMVANKDTTERPAPQESGLPSFELPEIPLFGLQQYTGTVWTGHTYEFTVGGWALRADVWVPEITNDTTYRVLFGDVTDPDPANHVWTTVNSPALTAGQWSTVSISRSVASVGQKLAVVLDAINSGSDTTVTGGWTRAGNAGTGDPGLQQWGTQANANVLRINYTDLDSTDRSTELQGITSGTVVTIVNTADNTQSMEWVINAPGTDFGTYIQFDDVTYAGPGPSGEPPIGTVCTFTALIPVAATTQYEQLDNYFATNQPTWANVSSVKRLGGVDDPVTDHAFGVRLQFQPAYISPDWDYMAFTE